jgi:N-acetylglucosaminyl-diphospho-decaprenol L-rhamnosyltransferase
VPDRRVSALIVSYNTRDLLLEAIASVNDEPAVEVIVVDNASSDGSAAAVAQRFPSVRLITSQRNLGFAGGTNVAAQAASGRDLLLLNPDAALTPGALRCLVDRLVREPLAAAVGPSLVYPSGKPQPAAFRFPGLVQVALDLFPIDRLMDSPLNGRLHTACAARQIDHPLGACMLIRGSAWHDVGPLDDGYFMYLEEVDWCQRARRNGWQIWFEPSATVVHHAGAATRQQPDAMFEQLWRSRLRYYQRYNGPVYNRLIQTLIRLGMRAAARRDGASRARAVRQLVR